MRLVNVGIDGPVLALIPDLLDKTFAQMEFAGLALEPFEIGTSVTQGSILSPLLYCLYINPILEHINNMTALDGTGRRVGLSVDGELRPALDPAQFLVAFLGFADDGFMLDPHLPTLQAMLDRFASLTRVTSATQVNVSKTKFIIFSTPGCTSKSRKRLCEQLLDEGGGTMKMNGVALPLVSSVSYLGATFSDCLGWGLDRSECLTRARNAWAAVRASRALDCSPSLQSIVKYFDALVRPHVEKNLVLYGAASRWPEAERFVDDAMLIVHHCPILGATQRPLKPRRGDADGDEVAFGGGETGLFRYVRTDFRQQLLDTGKNGHPTLFHRAALLTARYAAALSTAPLHSDRARTWVASFDRLTELERKGDLSKRPSDPKLPWAFHLRHAVRLFGVPSLAERHASSGGVGGLEVRVANGLVGLYEQGASVNAEPLSICGVVGAPPDPFEPPAAGPGPLQRWNAAHQCAVHALLDDRLRTLCNAQALGRMKSMFISVLAAIKESRHSDLISHSGISTILFAGGNVFHRPAAYLETSRSADAALFHLARTGILPTKVWWLRHDHCNDMKKVADASRRFCPFCLDKPETILHLVGECPRYASLRATALASVRSLLEQAKLAGFVRDVPRDDHPASIAALLLLASSSASLPEFDFPLSPEQLVACDAYRELHLRVQAVVDLIAPVIFVPRKYVRDDPLRSRSWRSSAGGPSSNLSVCLASECVNFLRDIWSLRRRELRELAPSAPASSPPRKRRRASRSGGRLFVRSSFGVGESARQSSSARRRSQRAASIPILEGGRPPAAILPGSPAAVLPGVGRPFRVFPTPGDGSCFFHSLERLLGVSHVVLRREAVAEIRTNWHLYQDAAAVLPHGESRDEYCDFMSLSSSYADEIEFAALEKVRGVQVVPWRFTGGVPVSARRAALPVVPGIVSLNILHVVAGYENADDDLIRNHYEALVPLHWPALGAPARVIMLPL
jgi:hypothetical protein